MCFSIFNNLTLMSGIYKMKHTERNNSDLFSNPTWKQMKRVMSKSNGSYTTADQKLHVDVCMNIRFSSTFKLKPRVNEISNLVLWKSNLSSGFNDQKLKFSYLLKISEMSSSMKSLNIQHDSAILLVKQ